MTTEKMRVVGRGQGKVVREIAKLGEQLQKRYLSRGGSGSRAHWRNREQASGARVHKMSGRR